VVDTFPEGAVVVGLDDRAAGVCQRAGAALAVVEEKGDFPLSPTGPLAGGAGASPRPNGPASRGRRRTRTGFESYPNHARFQAGFIPSWKPQMNTDGLR
jgi:hypothetical protein